MNRIKLFKKFLMPCGICAAVPVIKQTSSKEEPVNISNEPKKFIKPSELPIYTFEKMDSHRETPCKINDEPNIIEQGFSTVRKSIQGFSKQFSNYTGAISNVINTGYAHSQGTLDYLRQESNILPRVGAVGIGGLSGLIFGLRGGKFKKLLYSSTGALIVASICYPSQAKEGMTAVKYYINIGYNFLYGVKPGEGNQLEIPWPAIPKIPTNISEVKDLATTVIGSASSGVGTLFSKAKQAYTEFAETPTPPDSKRKTS